MKKTEYKPNYAVHPSETIEELCLYKTFGKEWAQRIQNEGIDRAQAYLYEAMFGMPRQFFINLQDNYEKTASQLKIEKEAQESE